MSRTRTYYCRDMDIWLMWPRGLPTFMNTSYVFRLPERSRMSEKDYDIAVRELDQIYELGLEYQKIERRLYDVDIRNDELKWHLEDQVKILRDASRSYHRRKRDVKCGPELWEGCKLQATRHFTERRLGDEGY